MMPDGRYQRPMRDEDAFSAMAYFMTNPSLSGRGRALKKIGGPAHLEVSSGD
jgi:polyphosphate kinase